MSASMKSKLLFGTVTIIAIIVSLQMVLFLAHEVGLITMRWGFYEYCLILLENKPIELRVTEVLIYGLIIYTTIQFIRKIVKQARLMQKLKQKINCRRCDNLSGALTKEFQHFGIPIYVIQDSAFLAFAVGLVKPRVVVSTFVIHQFTEQEVRAIILHELHHCLRKDPLKSFIVALIISSMRYVPILQRLAHSYKIWQELLADRFAIMQMGSSYDLGSVLIKLVGSTNKSMDAALSFADAGINYRIQQILNPSEPIRVPIIQRRPALLSVFVVSSLISFVLGGCA